MAKKRAAAARKKKAATKKTATKKRATKRRSRTTKKTKKTKKKHPALAVTDEQIATALREARGMVTVAASRLGVTDRALHYRMASSPELQQVKHEAREANKDLAESALLKAIEKGESWAICFFLKCQARDRGYIERVDARVEGNVEHRGVVGVDVRAVVAELEANPEWLAFARRRLQDRDAGVLRSGGESAGTEEG